MEGSCFFTKPTILFNSLLRMAADQDWSPMQVQVWPVLGERSLYYIRLRTSHYSFCLRSSCVIRDINEFYQLRSILTVSENFPCPLIIILVPYLQTQNTYMTIPSLPLQPLLWVSSYKTISNAIATFLSEVMKVVLKLFHMLYILI